MDKPKDRQTERDLLMGRQTDRQADGCTNYRDRLVDEQVEMLINGQTDRQMDRPGDRLENKQIWFSERQTDDWMDR